MGHRGRLRVVKPFPEEWARSHTESVADAVNRQSCASQALEVGIYMVCGMANWVLRKVGILPDV